MGSKEASKEIYKINREEVEKKIKQAINRATIL
jgi:hypothetical protein